MYKIEYHTESLENYSFLITGGAGFIGSNLVEYLLLNKVKKVRVLDNLSTGFYENIKPFEHLPNFEFIEGDIRDFDTCKEAMKDIDYVSHQAALGSVPRSISDPVTSNQVNISGFLNMITALKDSGVKRMVYAASSSTYGDSKNLPKQEDIIGKPLSPYAITKYVNELYADVFGQIYDTDTIGLRYFNVFGPKQSPKGAYAAVIPLFIKAIQNGESPKINGDGGQTRDFTFVENAVQANVRAFFADQSAKNQVFNIACGDRISLNQLIENLQEISGATVSVIHGPERLGDIRDSLADISKANRLLNYKPEFDVKKGLKVTWDYAKQ
ncbi:MAG: SDR family oxidoreductase [Flavobacteriaceae bacterium]|nr:SDR family oxidoreductase [Flavobacteriaceae bacterium]